MSVLPVRPPAERTPRRELVYYVAASLDGFIASPDGSFAAFDAEGDHMTEILDRYRDALPTTAAQGLGIEQRGELFSTVLMGWNTYAMGLPVGMTSPYRHLEQIVLTRRHRATGEGVTSTAEDPVSLVRRLRTRPGSGIWLCGGGLLAGHLLDEIDRLVIKRNPIVLGDGIPLFGHAPQQVRAFTPTDLRRFASGVVIEEHERVR